MRTRWQYFKTAFIQTLHFRAEVLTWIILGMLPTLLFVIAWSSIFIGHEVIKGYTLDEMIVYYIIVNLITAFTGVYFESHRSAQIREGHVDHSLIKPLSYPSMIVLHDMGRKLIFVSFYIPMLLLLIFGLSRVGFSLATINTSLTTIATFLIIMMYTYALELLIGQLVVYGTFWFDAAEGLQHFKWFFLSLFSGRMIPIVFMPFWLKSIVNALPFKYSYALPAQLLQGKASITAQDVFYMASFLLGIYVLNRFVWKKALLRYSSAGG